MNLAAESAQDLFVEERRQAARQRLVDDETNRIRADVDDRDRGPGFARGMAAAARAEAAAISGGRC